MRQEGIHIVERTEYDNSMIEAYKRCARRFYFNYVRCIRPEKQSLPLIFGSCWHNSMDSMWIYWDVNKAFDAFMKEWDPNIDEMAAYPRSPGRAKDMLIQYKDRYENVNKRDFKRILAIEEPFRVPLSTDENFPFYIGRLDKVVEREDNKIIIPDHKTTITFKRNWEDSFSPSGQMDGYAYAGKLIYGDAFHGVLVDGALTQKGEIDFKRIPLIKDNAMIDAWFLEVNAWVDRIQYDVKELLAGNYCFDRRDVACSDYSGCPYLHLCKMWAFPWEKDYIPDGYKIDIWDPIKENIERGELWKQELEAAYASGVIHQ